MKRIVFIQTHKTDLSVHFQVAEQTHRTSEFSDRGRRFVASNGIILSSSFAPEWRPRECLLYVRGNSEQSDRATLVCSPDDWEKI